MLFGDLLIGYLLGRSLGKRDALRPPEFTTSQVPFPAEVQTKPEPVPSGQVRAVECWQIATAVLPSESATKAEAVSALERSFPTGWRPVKNLTAAEIARARTLLREWRAGGVRFEGPMTPADRRAFVMTKHARPGAPAPTAPTTAPAPTAPTTAPAPGTSRTVVVQKGEGLAQVAKRLGKPANATSAAALRAANVPRDAGGKVRKSVDLSKGGLAPALQPGDRLNVPTGW